MVSSQKQLPHVTHSRTPLPIAWLPCAHRVDAVAHDSVLLSPDADLVVPYSAPSEHQRADQLQIPQIVLVNRQTVDVEGHHLEEEGTLTGPQARVELVVFLEPKVVSA